MRNRNIIKKNKSYNENQLKLNFKKKIKNKDLKKRINLIPVKRMAKTKEITDLIFYLINSNNFINNELINIAGGE